MSYLDKKLKEMTKIEKKIIKQVGGKYIRQSILDNNAIFMSIILFGMFGIVVIILSIFGIVETSIEFDFVISLIYIAISLILGDSIISGLGRKTNYEKYHYITEKSYNLMCDIDTRIVDKSAKESLMDTCIGINTLLIMTQIELDLSKMSKVKNANIHALVYDRYYIVSKVMEELMKEVINYSITHDNFADILTSYSVSRYKKIVDNVVSNFNIERFDSAVSSNEKTIYTTYGYIIDHMCTVNACKRDIIKALEDAIIYPSNGVSDNELITNLFYAPYSVLKL